MSSKPSTASNPKKNYKDKSNNHHHRRNKEDHGTNNNKVEEPELPKYRDRAKERREDLNPDYELTSELGGSFHSVAPPGTVELRSVEAQKISIENSKYLGGDVEHTHLVKGLDYALLNKIRSEIDKKPDGGDDGDMSRSYKEEQQLSFRTATAKSVYQWIVKPQTAVKLNEMFLPGRMAFIFNTEMVTVSVDGSVLDRIAKIMSYLRLGSSGKVLKKKKKDKDARVKFSAGGTEYEEEEKPSKPSGGMLKNPTDKELMLPPLPPPPPPPSKDQLDVNGKQGPAVARTEEDDIFVGDGVDYAIPSKDMSQSPVSEDMEESPRNRERGSYFNEPVYGPIPPSDSSQQWAQTDGYDGTQTQAFVSGYQGDWQDYQYAEQLSYPEQYLQQNYDPQTGLSIAQDTQFMTQEEKDRGLGSVFKRDDSRLQQLREKDAREKDPNFVSESYSECYPGYQEYNREVVDSDDEDDLSKMDMGGRAKGRLHRWDFETEEEWATYNEQKEAMPKAAFQFGVKMQDGRKTRKQNRDQKLTNDLHKINKILARKKSEKGEIDDDGGDYNDDSQPGKKLRI